MVLAESATSMAVGAYAVMVAAIAGSFVNLAADRLPRGESVVRPRSHCRACGRTLNLIDLIPVAGYVIRSGRCAGCKEPIGVSSPLVEAACAAVMAAAIAVWGLFPGVAVGLVGVAALGGGWVLAVGLARARREARSG